MAVIWCAISSHGLGHAAQVVPVLNELGRLVPGLKAILRTQVPEWFFQDRLTIEWTCAPAQQDVGCIQHGPLTIDVAATWDAHARFHAGWDRKIREEIRAIETAGAALVLSDISYLAVEAGAGAGIPAVGLCNLSWDRILQSLADPKQPHHRDITERIRRAYIHAELMLRPTPGIPLTAFKKVTDIGPIARPLTPDAALRQAIGVAPSEQVVLIGFGGIALNTLPFEQLDRLDGYRFVVSGPVPGQRARIRAAADIPLSFGSLLASADLLVTKPGYSTVVEAVALGKPVVYVRRFNFADEQTLVDYLHRHGRAVELSKEDFSRGQWRRALVEAAAAPLPRESPPSPTGAADAARRLARYFA
jgi:hypothetical protein